MSEQPTGKRRRRTWQEEAVDGASYCRVHENVWIGNMGAAMRVARGTIKGEFQAVFNASSSEAVGVTFEDEYLKLGVSYDTLMDEATGVAIGDSSWRSVKQMAAGVAAGATDEGIYFVPIRRGGRTVMVHRTPFVTRLAFDHLMAEASDKIERLLRDIGAGGQLLVHCMAGQNRSVSAVVSHLVLARRMDPTAAILLCADAIWYVRRTNSLTNSSFRAALMSMREDAADRAALRESFMEEYRSIVETAEALAPGPPLISAQFCEGPPPDRDEVARGIVERLRDRPPDARCRVCGSTDYTLEKTGDRWYCSDRCVRAVSC